MRQILGRLRHSKKQFLGFLYDFINGVETNISISESALDFKSDEYYPYIASDVNSFKKILKKLEINKDDIFLDVGCGKGRVLLIANSFGFKKLYGIDISENLVNVAKENTKNLKNITFEVKNAAYSSLPDDVNFIYMYSTFIGDSFDHFLIKIRESLARNNRKITFLYQMPNESEKVLKCGLFRQLILPVPRFKETYHLYESIPLANQKS